MIFYIYVGLIILLVIGLSLTAIFKKTLLENKAILTIFKIAVLSLAAVFTLRYMLGASNLENVVGLSGGDIENKLLTLIAVFLNWFTIAAVLVLILTPFFRIENNKSLITYFVLPISILNIIFFYYNSIALVGGAAFDRFNIRLFFYFSEVLLTAVISIAYVLKTRKFKLSKKELTVFLITLAGVLLATMPSYSLQALFGAGKKISLIDFTLGHRMLIYFSLIIPAALYISFRHKSLEVKKYVCLIVSLATLITFSADFLISDFANNFTNLPLHLCHTAMYILPICLIFRLEKIFYFTLFINVLGAFLAILIPDLSVGTMFSPSHYAFWINHFSAFFMPFLIVAFGIYERPKWKFFTYSMIGFLVYFVAIIFINAWFSNYSSVDYFFLNGDFVVSKLGRWAKNTRKIIISFSAGGLSFTFYPLYQALFFFVYVAAAFGMWFLYEQAYAISDNLSKLFADKKKIKMDELALAAAMGGRSLTEPVNEGGRDMLRIINFSKRYGNSKNYSVKNASLEINAGEIFGFLGPNGAGKSTIIKSIVGIQPITEGKIEVCGYDIEKQGIEAKRQIGFVPDHYALYEKLTGREYINYIADLYKVTLEERNSRISHYLDIFELNHAFDSQMRTYSHGMKQKIAIMAALVHDPKIWILDEPLTGLDPNSIYQVKECLKEHAKRGNIVFFSSHIIDIVEKICDRIAIIKKGEIVACVSMKELEAQNKKLEDFYLMHIGQKGAERNE